MFIFIRFLGPKIPETAETAQKNTMIGIPNSSCNDLDQLGSDQGLNFPGFVAVFEKSILLSIWVFPKILVPQNGWFIMENHIKIHDLGVPLFLETPNLELAENHGNFSGFNKLIEENMDSST